MLKIILDGHGTTVLPEIQPEVQWRAWRSLYLFIDVRANQWSLVRWRGELGACFSA
ncbi:hypothetical protein NSPZN2_11461 [Nitrospira defluvii]|uniref:Transposase n=1 Tax=Nitrospira defluvii TaxID=330214 RepID=A0ABM8QUH3_9BACT|nr:hypothetical protein NSPZN2_11461 [Nitrospira defluvii]